MQLFGGMLRKYRARLPHSTWCSVCMHIMHVIEETLSSMDPSGADERRSGHQKESQAVAALVKQTYCVLHSMLHEPNVCTLSCSGSSVLPFSFSERDLCM